VKALAGTVPAKAFTPYKEIMMKAIRFLPLLILVMLVNILSQTTHETGHHLVYQLMGHEPVWAFTKLVQIWETPPNNPSEWVKTRGSEGELGWLKLSSPIVGKVENAVAAATGPLAGLLGAVLGLFIASRSQDMHWRQIGLAFSLTASLTAVLYYLRAPIRTGGDEYGIAITLSADLAKRSPKEHVDIFHSIDSDI